MQQGFCTVENRDAADAKGLQSGFRNWELASPKSFVVEQRRTCRATPQGVVLSATALNGQQVIAPGTVGGTIARIALSFSPAPSHWVLRAHLGGLAPYILVSSKSWLRGRDRTSAPRPCFTRILTLVPAPALQKSLNSKLGNIIPGVLAPVLHNCWLYRRDWLFLKPIRHRHHPFFYHLDHKS